ncbi:Iron(3+)-hydroxamate-binding protein FhuD precursor [bacterium YEK0313]|nr:Iron(3+)-hydroxamate-binding protein FhuD precursor [bacterium YEK0313]
MLDRRALLALPATGLLMAPRAAEGHGPPRIACLDWAGAEALLSLGLAPAAAIDPAGYTRTVIEPALPVSVVDLGAGWAPNIEMLQHVAPDLILIPPWPGRFGPIERIAPVAMLPVRVDGRDAIDTAREVLWSLAQRTGSPVPAAVASDAFDAAIARARHALAGYRARPVYYVFLSPDGREVAVSTPGGLVDDVLTRLGLANAWSGGPSSWGVARAGIEELAGRPEALIIHADEGAPTRMTLARLSRNPIWSRLPAVRAGRVHAIPPIYRFGGLATGARLARLLATGLPAATGGAGVPSRA